MKKSYACVLIALMGTLMSTASLAAGSCVYTPDEKTFKFSFTAFGAPDKSYIVTKNTFKKYQLASSTGKLEGATIDIDATSLDTSNDLNNGSGGTWDPALANVRNMNVVTGLFKNFANPGKIQAKIVKIDGANLDLEVNMNGVTKVVPMKLTEKNGVVQAKGTLDIIKDFNGGTAFEKFGRICTQAFHKGKTWTDVDIEFEVAAKKACK